MCHIVSENAEGCGGTVNRASDCAEEAAKRGSIKKVLWEIFQNPQKTPMPEFLFDKVRHRRSATLLKIRL